MTTPSELPRAALELDGLHIVHRASGEFEYYIDGHQIQWNGHAWELLPTVSRAQR